MLIAAEAIIEKNRKVRLQKPIRLSSPCRAIVTILDKKSDVISETALLSKVALSEDWNRPEEERSMVSPSESSVVLVKFPFSGLSSSKLRISWIFGWIFAFASTNYGECARFCGSIPHALPLLILLKNSGLIVRH